MRESEKRLSQNIYERGVDDAGFGRIRSKGDPALFGGYTTQEMKERLGVTDGRTLADFLPTLSIAAKNPAAAMTKSMLYTMPIMMGVFAINMPAGLGLYWTISNLFGILQQVILSKHYKKKFAEEAAQ